MDVLWYKHTEHVWASIFELLKNLRLILTDLQSSVTARKVPRPNGLQGR